MVCALFGHRDAPETILTPLQQVITELIEQNEVTDFLIGNQGAFDKKALAVIQALQKIYTHIRYTVVLAYPTDKIAIPAENTLYPAGIEKRPLRFAIEYRNLWMIKQADFVIVYMTNHISKTAQLTGRAKRRGLKVINIAEK